MVRRMSDFDDRSSLDQAKALLAAGDVARARAILDLLAQRYPDDAETAVMYASALMRAGDLAAALPFIQRVRAVAPTYPAIHLNEGLCLLAAGQLDEAVAAFRAAVAAKPGDGRAAYHAIRTLSASGALDEAIALHRAASADLTNPEYLPSLAGALLPDVAHSLAHMQQARDAYEAAIANLGVPRTTLSEQRLLSAPGSFFAAYQGVSNRVQNGQIAAYYAALCPDLVQSLSSGPSHAPRLRVGFVSAHLKNHTIGKLTRGLIAELDRTRFEVCVFRVKAADDEIARFTDARADHVDVLPASLAEARAMLAAARLDILLYTDIGMEPFTSFLSFARLAPVQCVTWGHPVTTGHPNIDYFISGDALENADAARAQSFYSETLVRLAVPPTYLYPARHSPIDAEFAFPDGATLYVCPQQPAKFHPSFDVALIEILRRDANGILVLIDMFALLTPILLRRLRAAAPDIASRIHVVPRLDQARFYELLKEAHVVLDTTHFSGGVSSAEAFEFGKAVVTLPHPDLMAGRVTAAYYRQMGVERCIARDLDDYVAIAVRLGSDAAYRAETEAAIVAARNRLFLNTDGVRALEAFFVDAAARV